MAYRVATYIWIIGGSIMPEWRESAISRLYELMELPEGWDGYQGEPVDESSVIHAISVIDAMCTDATPEPQIVPGPSGEVQIEWHLDGIDIEIHIYDDIVRVWSATEETGRYGYGDEWQWSISNVHQYKEIREALYGK